MSAPILAFIDFSFRTSYLFPETTDKLCIKIGMITQKIGKDKNNKKFASLERVST